jgi:DNA-binding NtrC family response regulator
LLVQHFAAKYAAEFEMEPPAFSARALALLQADPWPGNVRELENVTRRLLLSARGLSVDDEAVRSALAARDAASVPGADSLSSLVAALLARAQRGELSDVHGRAVSEVEREVVTQAILLARGNQAQAARWLGLSRFTLREKLKQLNLYQGRGPEPEPGPPEGFKPA